VSGAAKKTSDAHTNALEMDQAINRFQIKKKMSRQTREEAISELPRRNGAAVEQKLREMDGRLYDMQTKLMAQEVAIGSALLKIQALENLILVQKAKMTGHGPSEI